MNGYLVGDLRTPEAVSEWYHVFCRRQARLFLERQARINWAEFASGSYRHSVAYWSRRKNGANQKEAKPGQ